MTLEKKHSQFIIKSLSLLAILSIVFGIALNISLNRHFQSDEFALSKSINILNFPEEFKDIVYLQFYMVPLSYLTGLFSTSKEILLSLRVVFLLSFMASLFLISGAFLKKNSFTSQLIIFFIVLTQYPMWRFGIEIRHEVMILLGFSGFCTFFLSYLEPKNIKLKELHLFLSGLFNAFLAQAAFKGLVYFVGLFLLSIICLHLKEKNDFRRTLKSVWIFGLGHITSFFIGFLFLVSHGLLGDFVSFYLHMFDQSLLSNHFGPKGIFSDMLLTSPIIVFLFFYLLIRYLSRIKTYRLGEHVPFIFTIGVVLFITLMLFKSPFPFRYNILIILASMMVFNIGQITDGDIKNNKFNTTMILGINLVIFLYSAGKDHYLTFTNKYQLEYIKTAEHMTTPTGRIIDGMGTVATRPQARKQWALYNSQMPLYMNGTLESFDFAFKERVPEVAITNYRWTWLPDRDLITLKKRYLPIGDHIWILGTKLKESQGNFSIHKAGRYKVIKTSVSDFMIEEKSVTEEILHLETGDYNYEFTGKSVALYWLGPKATKVPFLFIKKKIPFIISPLQ